MGCPNHGISLSPSPALSPGPQRLIWGSLQISLVWSDGCLNRGFPLAEREREQPCVFLQISFLVKSCNHVPCDWHMTVWHPLTGVLKNSYLFIFVFFSSTHQWVFLHVCVRYFICYDFHATNLIRVVLWPINYSLQSCDFPLSFFIHYSSITRWLHEMLMSVN